MTNREWAISENGIYSPYENDNNDFYIQELETKIEKLEKENMQIEELEDDLKFFIRNFIELGNHESDFHKAYAKLFEIYKGYGYEKYYKKGK